MDFLCAKCGDVLEERGYEFKPCASCIWDAKDESYKEGYKDGYKEGYKDGHDVGLAITEEL